MSIEASDHPCPHLRGARQTGVTPATVPPAPSAVCPAGASRSPADPVRPVVASASAGGWWAFCSQASAVEARA